MERLTGEAAERLVRRAARRRADGSRGMRAQRAWARLVQACAAGDAAAQEAVRTAELPDADVLDLLAVGPEEPADRAAYLTLIGQSAQRQALDPDGSLLALAYRAATPALRERLRTLMAGEGDTDVIRVVVTGEQRDRIAEMSYDELDYLGHHLAERRNWAELRRLARDLPLAKAAAAARLLPILERTEGVAELLSGASVRSPGQLRALVGRLPQRPLITHDVYGHFHGASFSPDTSELALRYTDLKAIQRDQFHVETLRIGTGEATRRFSGSALTKADTGGSVLHLGEEILVRLEAGDNVHQIVRILPTHEAVGLPTFMSDMRRSSHGAVVICPGGPAFVDPAADELRHQLIPRFTGKGGSGGLRVSPAGCALATLPAARLIAFCNLDKVYVATEDGDILHTMTMIGGRRNARFLPTLSFLSRNSLARHLRDGTYHNQFTEIWDFPPNGTPRRTEEQLGAIRKRWPLEKWGVPVLDAAFAARVYSTEGRWIDTNPPWLHRSASDAGGTVLRKLAALTPGQDMFVVARNGGGQGFEVHSPHLPSARALLEQPLLHSGPHDVRRILELRPKIGDPAVRDALDLLAACLTDRFGGDIGLSSTGPVAAGGPTDIALGRSRHGNEDQQPDSTHQGDA